MVSIEEAMIMYLMITRQTLQIQRHYCHIKEVNSGNARNNMNITKIVIRVLQTAPALRVHLLGYTLPLLHFVRSTRK